MSSGRHCVVNLHFRTEQVSDLRKELESRGLSSRGLKASLIERLSEALEEEKKAE